MVNEYWVVIDIGCLECGSVADDSIVLGLYPSREEAELVRTKLLAGEEAYYRQWAIDHNQEYQKQYYQHFGVVQMPNINQEEYKR